jgi:hypothetical protein
VRILRHHSDQHERRGRKLLVLNRLRASRRLALAADIYRREET